MVQLRHPMLEYLELQDVGPSPRLRVDFGERLNLLTGDNGVGKTFLLEVAWRALTETWNDRMPWISPEKQHVNPRIHWRVSGQHGEREDVITTTNGGASWGPPPTGSALPFEPIKPGLVIYVRVDGGVSVWDPARYYLSSTKGQGFEDPGDFYHFTPEEVWTGLSAGEKVLSNGLLRDWVTWQDRDKPQEGRSSPFSVLKRVLKTLSPPGEELSPGPAVQPSDDAREIPTIRMPYDMVPVTFAAAGIKRILSLAYILVWSWERHRQVARNHRQETTDRLIVLYDEVEAHLHPRWQRAILPAVLEAIAVLSESLKIQLIATTHAPLVLASVEPLFDEERDALFLFNLIKEEIVVEKLPWQPQGDASAWLTSVFQLEEARSIEAEQAIGHAMQALRQVDLPLGEVRRIHHQLRAVLKDTDPFWARWLLRAKQAGIEP